MRAHPQRNRARAPSLALLCLCLSPTACVPTQNSAPSRPRPESTSIDTSGPGSDRIGLDVTSLLPQRFIGEKVTLDSHITLIRWWTDGCPYCAESLPAIESLRARYAGTGFQTLGIYHPKPPRAVSDEFVRSTAEKIGYEGPLAVDELWDSLKKIWLDTGAREATSVSFLVDRQGTIRFVHPGPEFHPSRAGGHESCNADFERLDAAIQELIAH